MASENGDIFIKLLEIRNCFQTKQRILLNFYGFSKPQKIAVDNRTVIALFGVTHIEDVTRYISQENCTKK